MGEVEGPQLGSGVHIWACLMSLLGSGDTPSYHILREHLGHLTVCFTSPYMTIYDPEHRFPVDKMQ